MAVEPKDGQKADSCLITAKCETLFKIGEAQRNSGQLDDALTTYRDCLKIYPDRRYTCAEAAMGVAKVYQKKEDYSRALESYAGVLNLYSDKLITADMARFRIEYLRQKLKGYPSPLEAEIIKAIQVYEAAKKEDDEAKRAIEWAKSDAGSKNVEVAKAALAELLKNPVVSKSRDRLYSLAYAQMSLKDKLNARLTFDKFLELAALECPPELYRWAKCDAYFNLGDSTKLIKEASEALSIYPDGPFSLEIRGYLAGTYESMGQFGKAAGVYAGMKAITPDEKGYKSGLIGAIWMRAGNWKEAAQVFAQQANAKKLSVYYVSQSFYNLGECYYHMGDLTSACDYMRKVIDRSPDSQWAYAAQSRLDQWVTDVGQAAQ